MVTRMAQRTSQAFGVIGEDIREDFEGYIPVELGVPGAIHLTHTAVADQSGHVVVPEAGADV